MWKKEVIYLWYLWLTISSNQIIELKYIYPNTLKKNKKYNFDFLKKTYFKSFLNIG